MGNNGHLYSTNTFPFLPFLPLIPTYSAGIFVTNSNLK
jgi:hypothetical protein